jgi:CheY-like chemotaxis protein
MRAKESQMLPDSVPDMSSKPGQRILVVDDNESSALTLTWAMEMFGYEVRTCFDGKSAVEVAHDFQLRSFFSISACLSWTVMKFAAVCAPIRPYVARALWHKPVGAILKRAARLRKPALTII